MLYRLAAAASHPPADFDLMAQRVREAAVATLALFALGALLAWVVVKLNADPDEHEHGRQWTKVLRRRR